MAHALILLFAKLIVPVFFLGMAGSALVVVVTLVRDLSEVWTSDEEGVSDL